jgi:hypothetical protein
MSSFAGTFHAGALTVRISDQFSAIASCSILDEASQSVVIKISYNDKNMIYESASNA